MQAAQSRSCTELQHQRRSWCAPGIPVSIPAISLATSLPAFRLNTVHAAGPHCYCKHQRMPFIEVPCSLSTQKSASALVWQPVCVCVCVCMSLFTHQCACVGQSVQYIDRLFAGELLGKKSDIASGAYRKVRLLLCHA